MLVTPEAGKLVKNAPAIAASSPLTAHAPAATRESRMPISAAVSGSAAVRAHRDAPVGVLERRRRRRAIRTIATTAAAMRVCGTVDAEERRRCPLPHGAPVGRMSVPTRRVSSVASTMLMPMVRMASASTPPWRRRSGRDEQHVEQRGDDRADDGRGRPARRRSRASSCQTRDEVGAEHQHRRVGEVDDVGRLEDDHEAHRDQRVDAAERQAAHQVARRPGSSRSPPLPIGGAEVGLEHARGRSGPAPGVPSAMQRPKSSTVTRSARPMTKRMSCSTSTSEMPSASRSAHDRVGHALRLVGVHAGHRLVEQQQRRLGAQRAAELDALAVAVGAASRPGRSSLSVEVAAARRRASIARPARPPRGARAAGAGRRRRSRSWSGGGGRGAGCRARSCAARARGSGRCG